MDVPPNDLKKVGGAIVFTPCRTAIKDGFRIAKELESLVPYVESHPGCKVIIDFSNVEYIASHTIGTLVGLLKRVNAAKGGLRICSLRKTMQEVFGILLLHRVFEICEDVDEALESLEAASKKPVIAV